MCRCDSSNRREQNPTCRNKIGHNMQPGHFSPIAPLRHRSALACGCGMPITSGTSPQKPIKSSLQAPLPRSLRQVRRAQRSCHPCAYTPSHLEACVPIVSACLTCSISHWIAPCRAVRLRMVQERTEADRAARLGGLRARRQQVQRMSARRAARRHRRQYPD
jgi:hypothetical protein